MAFLEQFSKAERDVLVMLPYRAGLWISSSDHTGGRQSYEAEENALAETINGLVHGMFESAFVHEIMAETFLRKDEWRGWGMDIPGIPAECKQAVMMIQGRLPQRDVDAYKRILMQIGVEVATAFREYHSHEPFSYRIFRWIGTAIDRVLGAVQGDRQGSEDLLNISYEEDRALNDLSIALRGDVNDMAERTRIITNS